MFLWCPLVPSMPMSIKQILGPRTVLLCLNVNAQAESVDKASIV